MAKGKEWEAEMREVIKLQEKVVGPEHPNTLESCYDFGVALQRQGRIKEAKEFATRAAEGARKVLGPDHPATQKYEKLLADLGRETLSQHSIGGHACKIDINLLGIRCGDAQTAHFHFGG